MHDDFQQVSLIMERAEPVQLVNCSGKTLRSLLAQCHTSSLSIRHCRNSDWIQDPSRMQLSCSSKDFDQPLSSSALHRLTTACVCCVQSMPDAHRPPDGLLSLKFPHAFQQTKAAVSRIITTEDVLCYMQDRVCHMQHCHNCRSCAAYAQLQRLKILCAICRIAITADHQLCMRRIALTEVCAVCRIRLSTSGQLVGC